MIVFTKAGISSRTKLLNNHIIDLGTFQRGTVTQRASYQRPSI